MRGYLQYKASWQLMSVCFAEFGVSMPLFSFYGHFQKHKEFEKSVRVEEIDGVKLVKNLAVRMEEMFWKKAEATRVRKTIYSLYSA